MKLLIGEYKEGRLSASYSESGDDVPEQTLQELKGRFTTEYRDANLKLTEKQLIAAATPDQDLIQAVHALEGLDNAANTVGKYVAEWYGLHQPLADEPWQTIVARESNAPGFGSVNWAAKTLLDQREHLIGYIETQARAVMPNASIIVGTLLAAKLLSCAGSLQRLARLPSSTVELLGAERALFRHLRDRRARPPKHGVLVSHEFVQRAPPKKRGKAARVLANAVAIAVKVDFAKGEPIGEKLARRVEVQLGTTRS